MGEGRSAFRIVTVKRIGKIPFGRPRHRCEDNIGMNHKEIRINSSSWVDSTQDRESPCDFGIEASGSISDGLS